MSRRLKPLKNQMLELIALLEAGIDFAEDDISVAPTAEILRRLDPILTGVNALAASFAYGKLVHDGFTLAIVGAPTSARAASLTACWSRIAPSSPRSQEPRETWFRNRRRWTDSRFACSIPRAFAKGKTSSNRWALNAATRRWRTPT